MLAAAALHIRTLFLSKRFSVSSKDKSSIKLWCNRSASWDFCEVINNNVKNSVTK